VTAEQATVVLMSDIHGNFSALEAVAGSLPDHDAVYVAGDHCFEGPEPQRVVDFIREQGWIAIMGNTDAELLEPPLDAKRKKRERIAWTREMLGHERLEWLGGLLFSARYPPDEPNGDILVVHANPLDMDTHLQPMMSEEALQPYLESVDTGMLAFGHLHIPYLRPVNGILLADVSSVGHPKDLDQRSAYTVVRFDGKRRAVEQVRVPYDIERAVSVLRASDMPFAEERAEDLLRASY
jgi:predicted phosphodiesterase